MPVQPTYPGVYIQEIPSGVKTITGVSTSIAAFFGRAVKGPINKAVRCTSLADFLRSFGGGHPSSDLGNSVKQFFGNGGSDCYVIRLAHNARQADIVLQNMNGTNVLRVVAQDAGNWGNDLRLEVDYNTATPDETFNLAVIYESQGATIASEKFNNLSLNPNSPRFVVKFVTQSSKLVNVELVGGFDIEIDEVQTGFSESRRPFNTVANIRTKLNELIYDPDPEDAFSKFELSVNDSSYITIDILEDPTSFAGNNVADLEDELTDKINNNSSMPAGVAIACAIREIDVGPVTRVIRITSDSGNNSSVRIRRASTNDLAAPLMLGLEQGGVEITRYANHRPVPTSTFIFDTIDSTDNLDTIAVLTQNAFNELTIVGASPPNVLDLAASGSNILETTVGTDRWYQDNNPITANENNDGVREKLALLSAAINNLPDFPVKVEVWGYRLALIPKSGTYNTSYSVTTSGTDIGNLFTKNVRQYALGNLGTSLFQDGDGETGRDDDGNPLSVADYTGSVADNTGFYALNKVDIFNLMVIPGDTDINEAEYQQLFGPASTFCYNNRAFLLLDAPRSWTNGERMDADASKVNALRAGIVKDHSAIFYPQLTFSDNGILKPIGAAGMIAGLIARTDSQRGVWKAPAGIDADLRGILDVELNLTDNENGVLNKLGVNCIRKFPNGIVNWGARTLDGSDDFGSEWKYIPIRRLALFIEESLFRGTKWVVFEPNDEPLWALIRLNINAFMMGLFRQGAFQGSTPDQAFFVKCDSETTTQNDRNLGIVNIQVGIAPLKPAEFVIITIQQMAGDLG